MLVSTIVLLLVGLAQHGTAQPAAEHPFAPGQVWQYHTRSGEEGSTLTILRVDKDTPLGPIVHIALQGVYLRGPDFGPMRVQHMPFAEADLRRSVVQLVEESGPVPEYEEGYRNWKRAFDARKAGAYRITVAEAVQVMADTLNQ